jgi:hypothetical protein
MDHNKMVINPPRLREGARDLEERVGCFYLFVRDCMSLSILLTLCPKVTLVFYRGVFDL